MATFANARHRRLLCSHGVNTAFIDQWHTFIKNAKRTTNDPMEAHYIGFNLWVKAVQKAKTTEVEKVIAALPGLETPNSPAAFGRSGTKEGFVGSIKKGVHHSAD